MLILQKYHHNYHLIFLVSRSTSTSSSASSGNALRRILQGTVAAAGGGPLIDVYGSLVKEGALRQDESQHRVANKLGRLSEMLRSYKPPLVPHLLAASDAAKKKGPRQEASSSSSSPPQTAAGQTRKANDEPAPSKTPASPKHDAVKVTSSTEIQQKQEKEAAAAAAAAAAATTTTPHPPRVLRGMYIHGKVGTGKSLVMDLFFHHCPLTQKRRVHFHDFILEVHARIHVWKQGALKREGRSIYIDLRPERNAITQIARQIAQETHVLCFDEFQVTDVADAVIMVRLFGELWGSGVVMVATSNRAPEELYLDGINRPYFLPFIDLLKRQCVVIDMDSERDHRQLFETIAGAYFYPLNSETVRQVNEAFLELAGGPGSSTTVPVMMGRQLKVPEARNGVCRFHFADLCNADVFAADYRGLCDNYHTLVLEGVPKLSAEKHNEARRFITLIDVLYEARARLIMSAVAPVLTLFNEAAKVTASNQEEGSLSGATRAFSSSSSSATVIQERAPKGQREVPSYDDEEAHYVDAIQELIVPEGELSSVKELSFAFRRAASRLLEMQSTEYLENHMEACSHLYQQQEEAAQQQ